MRRDQGLTPPALNARREIDRSLDDAFRNLRQKLGNLGIPLIGCRVKRDEDRVGQAPGGARTEVPAGAIDHRSIPIGARLLRTA
jgi:hypothetical protein